MTNSIECFSKAEVILVIGSNTTENHPVIANRIRRAVNRGTKLLLFDPRDIPLTRQAILWCRQKPGTDVALINGLMHVIVREGLADMDFVEKRTEGYEELRSTVAKYTPRMVSKITGVSEKDIIQAARIYASGKPASIAYAMGITQHTTGTDNVKSLANLAMLCGNMGVEGGGVNPLRGQNNVQGACDVGALPNVYPGYQKVVDPIARDKFEKAWDIELNANNGLTITEMLDAAESGRVKVLYIMGENPMLSDPDSTHVEKSLKACEFLVVQDIFLTETAKLADVVLPASSYAERDGTFTNTERRVQLSHRVIDPLPGTKPDWEIICELSNRLGYPMHYESVSEITDEIAKVTPQYGGILYERLSKGEQLCWPCPLPNHPGTPILHQDKFTRGLGKFHALDFIPPAELPDVKYPMILTTGRVLQHFHTGTMTRKSKGLEALAPSPFVEVNPKDAQKLGVEDGDWVKVSSRRGSIELTAKVDDKVGVGVIFIPFHYHEAVVNTLTNPALDPIAKIPEYKVCAARLETTA
jgi:formate dehydrogenase alpha subunit